MTELRQRFVKRKLQGFTLIEVLVVLVIIGLIMGLVGSRVFKSSEKARIKAAEVQVETIKSDLERFRLDMERYPTTEETLKVLLESHKDWDQATKEKWDGPYFDGKDAPKDPWGTYYVYEFNAEGGDRPYYLYSYGKNKNSKKSEEWVGMTPPKK
jgi:general secretion pathway protein G